MENPTMTQKQLMEALSLTRKQVQTDIRELEKEEELKRKGSNRKGYWIVTKREI